MSIIVTKNLLQFDYISDNIIYDKEKFFKENGSEKFDVNSKEQMLLMLQMIANKLNIDDFYSIKRAEITLKYELPFFAINRKLIKKWILENFIY